MNHTLVINGKWCYTTFDGSAPELVNLALERVKESDFLIIVPKNAQYLPYLNKFTEKDKVKFKVAINDGDDIRYNTGSYKMLLKWVLNQFENGNIQESSSIYIKPIKRDK